MKECLLYQLRTSAPMRLGISVAVKRGHYRSMAEFIRAAVFHRLVELDIVDPGKVVVDDWLRQGATDEERMNLLGGQK